MSAPWDDQPTLRTRDHHERRAPEVSADYRVWHGTVPELAAGGTGQLFHDVKTSPVDFARNLRERLIADGADAGTWVLVYDLAPYDRPDLHRNTPGCPHHLLAYAQPRNEYDSETTARIGLLVLARLKMEWHRGQMELNAAAAARALSRRQDPASARVTVAGLAGIPAEYVARLAAADDVLTGFPGHPIQF